ncbi:MAG: ABC transporter permease [Chloroflexales bacterium]|nr:ABC transporter permease [Chloroflexales bacterium]
MPRYIRLYWAFLLNRLKILMEYRLNFLIGASSTLVLEATSLLALWVVVRQVPDLNGWTLDEILLIYGLLVLAKSISHMFADNLWTLGWAYIRSGQFDRFLVRPIDPLFHLLADRFCHDGIGNFVIGSALVAKAWAGLAIPVTALNLTYLGLAVLSGGAIFIALNLITAVSAFWITNSIPVILVVFNTSEFAKYPLAIYPRAIGILMTWLIPYGFASFYPASYLMGRDVGAVAWLGPPVAVALGFVAYRFWQFGLRHYVGSGS